RGPPPCARAPWRLPGRGTPGRPAMRRPWRTCARWPRAPQVPSGATARSSTRLLSQHTPGMQVVDVAAGQPEQLAVHLGVVFTDPRAQVLHATGRCGEAGHRSLDGHRAQFVVADLDEDIAVRKLLVGNQIGDVVDR